MKKVDLNKAKFGDIFLDHNGKRVIYNRKRHGFHELLEEESNRLMPYTDDGWFRYHTEYKRPWECKLTKNIPVEERSSLTSRIVYKDDTLGLQEIHMQYLKKYRELLENLI